MLWVLNVLGGWKYKIHNMNVVGFVFAPTQWIQNLQHDIITYGYPEKLRPRSPITLTVTIQIVIPKSFALSLSHFLLEWHVVNSFSEETMEKIYDLDWFTSQSFLHYFLKRIWKISWKTIFNKYTCEVPRITVYRVIFAPIYFCPFRLPCQWENLKLGEFQRHNYISLNTMIELKTGRNSWQVVKGENYTGHK